MFKLEYFNKKRFKLEEVYKVWNVGFRGGELEDIIFVYLYYGFFRGR